MYQKISIIIPIYNAEQHLSKCLNSVVNQTYVNIEIILINDGSLDGSLDICNQYAQKDKRIVVASKDNEGVSIARNTGISMATGDYLTFLDADDWLEEDALETMLELIIKNDVDCVRTMYYKNYIDGAQQAFNLSLREGRYEKDEVRELIKSFVSGEEFCYTVLLLIKRNAMEGIGYFDPAIRLMEDVLFYVNALMTIDSIFLSNRKTYHYFQNNQSASSIKNYNKNIASILGVNKELKRLIKDRALLTKTLQSRIDSTHTMLVANYLFHLYLNGTKKREILELFYVLRNNYDYIELSKSIELSRLPFHLRFTLKALHGNNPRQMLLFFKFRHIAKFLRYELRRFMS